jgi:hypothetical protein
VMFCDDCDERGRPKLSHGHRRLYDQPAGRMVAQLTGMMWITLAGACRDGS